MEHGTGCKCTDCCYPQRPCPPAHKVETAKDNPGRARKCADKQVGDSGNNA